MDRSIWDCLEKSSAEGLLLTTCGTELQELMRQIDIMVRNKRMEWESELLSTQDSLSLREQELNHARLLLDQKHQEVGMLKHQLETYESNQTGVITQYEAQLKSLQTQLNDLKKKHEEMSQRRTKKSRHFADKEKELRSEVENLTMEVKEKRLLIAKHDKESSEWEISKRSLKHQLECLEKHKKTLTTNYERCQQQLSVTQERLQRSNSMVEEVEGTSQSLLRKLEEELSNDKELIQRQERVMCDLQDKIQQLESARHQANNDKYKYREQADKANCKLKVVEEEAARLQSALSARDIALRGSEREIVELKDELISTRSQLNAKDKLLSVMQQHSPATRRGVDAHELERKVALLEASVATMTETEGSLRAEVMTLEQQLAAARSEAGTLNDIVHNTEVAKVNTLNEEIRSLQNKLEDMEASHTSQLCGMKADVTNLAAHLHGRDANIARLSELCSDMERKLRDEAGRRDKLDHELATATSRLHQLQASTAPRGARDQLAPTRTSSTEKSLCEAEKQLEELQRGYGRAVSRLEEENQHLKGEVSGLKSELIMKDRMSKRESREEEEEDMKRKYEERIARLEQRILDVTGAGDDVIESNPSVVVRSDLPSDDDDEQRTPTPTRDFLLSIGIDPNASSVAPSSGESTLDERQLQAMILAVDEGFADSGAPSVDEYVADEERRVVELEGRIERHIDDMKHAMQVAMEKYLVPTPAQ